MYLLHRKNHNSLVHKIFMSAVAPEHDSKISAIVFMLRDYSSSINLNLVVFLKKKDYSFNMVSCHLQKINIITLAPT